MSKKRCEYLQVADGSRWWMVLSACYRGISGFKRHNASNLSVCCYIVGVTVPDISDNPVLSLKHVESI